MREQGEKLLDRDAGLGRDPAQCGGLTGLLEVLAQEPDRLPVGVGHLDADLGGERGAELLGPLRRDGEEALLVDVELVPGERGGRHVGSLLLVGLVGLVGGVADVLADHRHVGRQGEWAAGEQDVPVDPAERELPRWLALVSLSSPSGPAYGSG